MFKNDQSHQIIGGWFSVFKVDGEDLIDLDNECLDIPSYEAAAIDFAKNARSFNLNHSGPKVGSLIDSIFIGSPEFAKSLVHEITGLPVSQIPVAKLGHFGSVQIESEELYSNLVETGAMFSIEGYCDRVLEEEE